MKKYTHLLYIVAAVLLSACAATTTKMSGTWKAPDFSGKVYNKLLVLGVGDDETNRRMFEDSMVSALDSTGSNAVASYTVLPDSSQLSEASIKAAIKNYNYDGIIVTRFVAVDTDTQYVKGQSYVVPNGIYSRGYPAGYYNPGYDGFYRPGYYGYYRNSYSVIHEPGYTVNRQSAVLETNLYDVQNQGLVWSGRSTTMDPQSAGVTIPSVTAAITEELLKEGVIRK